MNVILLGPAASGKGTLSRALQNSLNLVPFETGAALRNYANNEDPALAAHLASGGMAPTDLVMRLLAEGTSRPTGAGFLLDGIPRNPEQASLMAEDIAAGRLTVDLMVVLDAPDDVLVTRAVERSTCPKCGAIYNATTKPSPAPLRCTRACGGILVTRPEDNIEGMKERLKLYREKTVPAIAMIKAAGVPTVRIDGEASPAEISRLALGHITRLVTPSPAPSASRSAR